MSNISIDENEISDISDSETINSESEISSEDESMNTSDEEFIDDDEDVSTEDESDSSDEEYIPPY